MAILVNTSIFDTTCSEVLLLLTVHCLDDDQLNYIEQMFKTVLAYNFLLVIQSDDVTSIMK